MKAKILALVVILSTSCSTIKRQRLYSIALGVVAGGTLGAIVGKELSPNKESDRINKLIGGATGALAGGIGGKLIGDMFWNENPENRPLPPMIIEDEITNSNAATLKNLNINFNPKILAPKNVKKIAIDADLPDFLRGKVKTGHVYVYEIEEYEEEIKEEGRIIFHEKHKAYEYTIE